MAIDLFSNHAARYAQFRPTYPNGLYRFIFSNLTGFDTAWDCGTGNGQAAQILAHTFKKVWATDISSEQIKNAIAESNITYLISAETTTFPDHSVDLITVAQAIHWFDLDKFYREVHRVAKPNALLAVWGYGLLHISELLDPLIMNFYTNKIGAFWNAERRLIDEHYKTIPFPFREITVPDFEFSFDWTLQQVEGYLTTWSAVQKFIQANKINPVPELIKEIEPLWRHEKMTITFPLFLRLGRIHP